jgi:2,3-bisphosphoglycerate-independent phosphoglycerate mutase
VKESKKVVLIIADGWGLGEQAEADAIRQADTPFFDQLQTKYPHATLVTHGESVGLPEGQMGNSEVGHLNIGAGRVVYQELMRINRAIADGSLRENEVLQGTFKYAKDNNKPLHLIGLVSDGGVHSHINHLIALCRYAHEAGQKEVYIHAFTDGRDCDPHSGYGNLQRLEEAVAPYGAKLVSAVGRYYAMDRDKRWERVKLAHDLLTKGEGKAVEDILPAIRQSYKEGVSDEFLKPLVLDENGEKPGRIKDGDAVLCFNFRTDRCREITQTLTQQAFPEFGMQPLQLYYVTMTRYDATYQGVHVVLEKNNLPMTMGEVLEKEAKTQIRIAETEKYPHVTFFFSGGREKPFEGESRILVNSPKVATYDLQPDMSALEVTEKICAELDKGEVDFVCLNFANADMVGHTGVFEAAMKAAETVDTCTKKVMETGLAKGYQFIFIADHGNADFMVNKDGSPNTAHTKNPVPIILVSNENKHKVRSGRLADVAPTILELMEIDQPREMTGSSLLY